MAPPGAALIGVGMVGVTFAGAFRSLHDQVRLTGVMGRRPESGAAFLKDHALDARVYGSVAEIAADPDVTFVVVATPPNARDEIVGPLAQSGKHILMEKPVERTLDAARALCDLCDTAGVTLGMVLQHRARPSAQALRELVARGATGALRVAEISVPWWRAQSYYDEPGRGTYERDGGGVLLTQGIHVIDLALQFTGPVREVSAMTSTTGFHQLEAEDFVSAALVFEGGVPGSLMASTASFPGRQEEVVLHFEHVSARLASNRLDLDWQDGRSETIGTETATGAGADPMAFGSELHAAIIADFADALATGRAPLALGRTALPVHALIAGIEASSRSGTRAPVEAV